MRPSDLTADEQKAMVEIATSVFHAATPQAFTLGNMARLLDAAAPYVKDPPPFPRLVSDELTPAQRKRNWREWLRSRPAETALEGYCIGWDNYGRPAVYYTRSIGDGTVHPRFKTRGRK